MFCLPSCLRVFAHAQHALAHTHVHVYVYVVCPFVVVLHDFACPHFLRVFAHVHHMHYLIHMWIYTLVHAPPLLFILQVLLVLCFARVCTRTQSNACKLTSIQVAILVLIWTCLLVICVYCVGLFCACSHRYNICIISYTCTFIRIHMLPFCVCFAFLVCPCVSFARVCTRTPYALSHTHVHLYVYACCPSVFVLQ